MATKIKPQRIESINTPSVGQVPKYVSQDKFERVNNGGGGQDVGTLFYTNKTSPIGYSERQDYYLQYTYSQSPSAVLHNHMYVYNGKGAPIMRGGVALERDDLQYISVNSNQYFNRLDLFHIRADGSTVLIENRYEDAPFGSCAIYGYLVDSLDNASPSRSALTINLNSSYVSNNRYAFIGFDGTYYYARRDNNGSVTYERYELSGTTMTYVDDRVPPLGLVPTYIRGQYIYVVSSNVIHEYDISTGVETTSGQYIGTRHWDFDDAVWTNINTTGDMHAIYKAFSH